MSPAARRQHDFHAGVDIEGLGHRLVYLIDRDFVGDELFQRMGFLECVQEAQAARVAGRGMVGHSKQANLVREQMPVRMIGIISDIGEHARDAPARWRAIMLLAEICILSPCPRGDAVSAGKPVLGSYDDAR